MIYKVQIKNGKVINSKEEEKKWFIVYSALSSFALRVDLGVGIITIGTVAAIGATILQI